MRGSEKLKGRAERKGRDGEKDIRGLEGWREGQKGRKGWRKGHEGLEGWREGHKERERWRKGHAGEGALVVRLGNVATENGRGSLEYQK